jgi:signal transduction histidine kinase
MKSGKLYIKIFFSFLILLIITEILIFGFYRHIVVQYSRSEFEKYIEANIFILRELIEDRLRDSPSRELDKNRSLQDLVTELSQRYQSKIWIEADDRRILIASFNGKAPTILKEKTKKFRNYSITRVRGRYSLYIIIPIRFQGNRTGTFNLLYQRSHSRFIERAFVFGLIGIGLLIALLVVPFSRFITKPLKRLRISALKIAQGNISERATINSRDEIGELGHAFNSMAETVERMIKGTKELTANISHELRSPLARMRIAVELLNERLQKSYRSSFNDTLSSISDEIDEMDDLIGKVLQLSKLEIQQTPPIKEEIDIAGIAKALLERFSSSIQNKSIELETEIPSGSNLLFANRADMHTALSNLMDNAIKFTLPGGKIRFKIQRDERGIEVIISNSCEPPADDDLRRIFEPFYRPKKSNITGTGLGLAITKKIIENHGGSLEALRIGEGISMRIFLPTK